MATSTIVARAKSLLYGHGLGEKPSIVQAAADSAESTSGKTVTFTLASGEVSGNKVEAGDVLSVLQASASTTAHLFYTLSVNATNETVTAVDSYMGAPAISTDSLDSGLLEVNPGFSEHFIYQAVETIIGTMLWPDIYKYNTYTVTPDLSDYQVELNAAVEEIENAFQIIGGEVYQIPFNLSKNVSTSVSSTGVLGELFAIDGSSVYVTTRERYLESDTFSEQLIQCIATGAAALSVGGKRSATDLEAAKKDSQFRGQRNPADSLWRDFITQRAAIIEDISSEVDWFEYYR